MDLSLQPLLDQPEPESPLLCDGTAGLALVHAVLARSRPDQGHEARSRDLLERTVALLGEVECAPGLWTGIAGVGWVLERLREPDEDPCEALDELLLEIATGWPEGECLDWIAGLSGLAAYAEARRDRPIAGALLAALVAVLADRAEPVPGGVAWCTTPAWYADGGRGRYDLGLAHGQPGVLAALGIAVEAGVNGAEKLLDAGLAGFFELVPDGAAIPGWVGGHTGSVRPHAWCYGAAGVGAALARLGQRLGRTELAARGRAMAEASLRLPPEASPPCGVCHGHASALVLARAVGDAALVDRWRGVVDGEPFAEPPDLLNGFPGQFLAVEPGLELWRDLLAI